MYAVTNLRKRSQSKLPVHFSDDDDLMLEPVSKKKRKSPMESQMTKMLKEMRFKGSSQTLSLTKECKMPFPLLNARYVTTFHASLLLLCLDFVRSLAVNHVLIVGIQALKH